MNMEFLLILLTFILSPVTILGFVPHQAILKNEQLFLTQKKQSYVQDQAPGKLSIAIIGSGAVGCYYGARLQETDQYNVIFHMRGDHYKASKECGLKVTSVDGDMFIPPDQLNAYDNTGDIGTVDWVILALKSTGIEATADLLRPILRADTRVICIMNGFVDEDIVRLLEDEEDENANPELTKCAAVYAGMAFLCSNRIAPGHVHHSYYGKLCGSLVKSSSSDTDSSNTDYHQQLIVALWKPTKIDFDYEPNYTKARWTKNVWNLPFNGISVAMNGITIDKIVNDPGLRQLAYTIMDETIAIANCDLKSRGYSEADFLGDVEVRLSVSI